MMLANVKHARTWRCKVGESDSKWAAIEFLCKEQIDTLTSLLSSTLPTFLYS